MLPVSSTLRRVCLYPPTTSCPDPQMLPSRQPSWRVLTHHSPLLVIVLASNQFGHQEPGSDAEIKKFAYGHGFTGFLMDKVDVNGPSTHPVYSWLKVGYAVTLLPGTQPSMPLTLNPDPIMERCALGVRMCRNRAATRQTFRGILPSSWFAPMAPWPAATRRTRLPTLCGRSSSRSWET